MPHKQANITIFTAALACHHIYGLFISASQFVRICCSFVRLRNLQYVQVTHSLLQAEF